jgi:hypothetical protein
VQVFRKYLDEKLNDPDFNKNFHDNCAICPTTVHIVTAISESLFVPEEIACQCDIPIEAIRNLEAADKCCVASVKKLCEYFGIPRPIDCLQRKGPDRQQ